MIKIVYLNEGKQNLIEATYSIDHVNVPNNGEYIEYNGYLYEVGIKTTDYDKKQIRLRANCNYYGKD